MLEPVVGASVVRGALAAAFPQAEIGAVTDAGPSQGRQALTMRASYAITWQESGAKPRSGRLELKPRGLGFEGSNGNGATIEEVDYGELSAVRIARTPGDRLAGRPTLVLERRAGSPIRIAGVAQPGIISELAEHLAAFHPGEEQTLSRVVVILPLKEGAHDRAAAVIERGPPFDPKEAGLERHQVFITDREAIFVFEADAADAVNRLAKDMTLWGAAEAWKDLVAGPPRIAEETFSWVQAHPTEYVSSASTPGPGDSEGGDLYPPRAPAGRGRRSR